MIPSLHKMLDWIETENTKKNIYFFDEGSEVEKDLLGTKGSYLCECARFVDFPVPDGFIISTEVCKQYFSHNTPEQDSHRSKFAYEYKQGISCLEQRTNKTFGGVKSPIENEAIIPLLLAVRSSVAVSMTGMMKTILNVGINDEVVKYMAKVSHNPRWAYDCYRRFIQMFGVIVQNIDPARFEDVIQSTLHKRGVKHESLLNSQEMQEIVRVFKTIASVPQDPWEQLSMAIDAVYNSWNSRPFRTYRDLHNIPEDVGIAIVVQEMVYGNKNIRSGSGMMFTRNPNDGRKQPFGEYLCSAEGDDIASGARTPMSLGDFQKEHSTVFEQLEEISAQAERKFKDMVAIEFTVDDHALYILQVSPGRRTPRAAVRISVEMVTERLISEREAVLRVDASQMSYFQSQVIDPTREPTRPSDLRDVLIASGIKASDGAASGHLVFSSEQAEECRLRGQKCILYRHHTTVEDIVGIELSDGVFTSNGGLTSHSAILTRELGKPAVSGCRGLSFNREKQQLLNATSSVHLNKGDVVTVDGTTGSVYLGEVPTVNAGHQVYFSTILSWADQHRSIETSALVAQQSDLQKAFEFQADSVLLCSEWLFTTKDSMELFHKFLCSETEKDRQAYLAQLKPIHKQQLTEVFTECTGKRVSIRLLDRKLADFGTSIGTNSALTNNANNEGATMLNEVAGAKLGVVYPEFTLFQMEVIAEALLAVAHKHNTEVTVLLPNIFCPQEMSTLAPLVSGALLSGTTKIDHTDNPHHSLPLPEMMIDSTTNNHDDTTIQPATNSTSVDHRSSSTASGRHHPPHPSLHMTVVIGSIAACLNVAEIVRLMSSCGGGGTGDDGGSEVRAGGAGGIVIDVDKLTEDLFGMSRNAFRLMQPVYTEKLLSVQNAFLALDCELCSLIALCVENAREANRHIKITVCGEQCGDAPSLSFLHSLAVDTVCCNPTKIPAARVGTAQAHIAHQARDRPHKFHRELLEEMQQSVLGVRRNHRHEKHQ